MSIGEFFIALVFSTNIVLMSRRVIRMALFSKDTSLVAVFVFIGR
jgi:hypothetical protein